MDGPALLSALPDLHLSHAAKQELLVELHMQTQRFPLHNSTWWRSGSGLSSPQSGTDEFARLSPSNGDFLLDSSAQVEIFLQCASPFCSLHGTLCLRVDGTEVEWSVKWSADASKIVHMRHLQRGRHVVEYNWCFTPGSIVRAGWGHSCSLTLLRGRTIFFVGSVSEEGQTIQSYGHWRQRIEHQLSNLFVPLTFLDREVLRFHQWGQNLSAQGKHLSQVSPLDGCVPGPCNLETFSREQAAERKGSVEPALSSALSAQLNDLGPYSLHSTCAVVGSSSVLLNDRKGREIDNTDAIFRVNWAPTVGYEEHVGSRTTHRVGGYEEKESAPGGLTYISALKCEEREVQRCMHSMLSRPCPWCLHMWPSGASANMALLRLFKELTTSGAVAASEMPGSGVEEHNLSWDWSQTNKTIGMSTGCCVTPALRMYKSNAAPVICSFTGFFAVAAALRLCKSVTVYGFSLNLPVHRPLHLQKANCGGGPVYGKYFKVGLKNYVAVPFECPGKPWFGGGDHPFEAEHRAFAALHALGLLSIQ